MIKKYYLKYKEIINYLIVGGLTTLVSLIVYYFFTRTILDVNNSLELQMANILSWIFAVIFAYFTNKKYVFECNRKDKKEIIKFFLSRIGTLFLDMAIMYIFVSQLKFNDRVMKIISQVCVIVLNYVLSKFIVFKKS